MNSRAGRQRIRLFGSVAVVAIAVLLAPQIAFAIDDPTGTLSDPVNAVTGTANDATGQVTGTANDATGQVTGTANDATGQVTGTANDATGQVTGTANDATGQVTGTANDATGQVTGTANDATGQVTGTANDATGQVTGAVGNTAGSVTSDVAHLGSSATTSLTSSQEAGSASTDPTGQGSADRSISRSGSSPSGPPRFAGLRTSEANYLPGGGIDTRSEEEGLTPGDPCESDQRLVCLGVLYGLGEFGDVGGKVITSLAQTGFAVLGLAALALLLAIAGSSALAASSRRMASVARTD